MTTYLLNSPILTNHGLWRFSPLGLEQARALAAAGFLSAIGHESSARLLSELLQQEVPLARKRISLNPGERAIVFRLLTRLPEGVVLDLEHLKKSDWELGLLECLEEG